MKRLSIFFIILFSIFNNSISHAKYPIDANVSVKDTAIWEIVYVHRMIDSQSERSETIYEILSVGNNYSYYGNYGQFQHDSIVRLNNEWRNSLSREESQRFYNSFKIEFDHILMSLKNKSLEYYGKIFLNHYRYSEPFPEIEWTLHDESIEVLGHKCHKATTTWRGRNWTAWYSDIPLSLGPWKFNGLPGLILRLEDDRWEHYFEATKSMNWKYPFGFKNKLLSKTTREKYNNELKDYKQNAGKMLIDSGMVTVTDEQRKKRMKSTGLFHLPIELE